MCSQFKQTSHFIHVTNASAPLLLDFAECPGCSYFADCTVPIWDTDCWQMKQMLTNLVLDRFIKMFVVSLSPV